MTLRQDLIITQGQTFSKVYTYYVSGSLADLTGYTARMSIRKRFGGSLWAYLSTGADADGGTLTLGDEAGTVTISMTATETNALATGVDLAELMEGQATPQFEQFVYDLELINGTAVTRVVEGVIEYRRGVTT